MRNLQKGNEEATDILAALVPRITYGGAAKDPHFNGQPDGAAALS